MLVDTNVLVDVLQNDPDWADWSVAQLRAQAQIHRLVINSVIYAELSLAFSTVEALDEALAALQIPVIEIPKPALFLAGKAFMQYRRQGGTKSNVLADFFIGAHAAVAGLPVLTREVRRYAGYFPTVPLISPSEAA
jgi:predicted nucleic acid-binding protein